MKAENKHKHVCVTKRKEERLKAEQLARQKAKAEAAEAAEAAERRAARGGGGAAAGGYAGSRKDEGQVCGGLLGGERRRGALTEYTSPLGS